MLISKREETGGFGQPLKCGMPVNGPVACLRMGALAELSHKNKRLHPHFQQLHAQNRCDVNKTDISELRNR